MAAHVGLVNAVQTFLDNTGRPLVGGKVYTYQAGTTTLQATYQDSLETVPNTNPVITDAAGRCVIWPPTTVALKLIVQDSSGVTLYTVDGLAAAAVAS